MGRHYGFDRLVVPWVLCHGVQDLLHGLKYEVKTFIAPYNGQAVAARMREAEETQGDHVVVPVPLHRARLRERGYNQCRLIADTVAGLINSSVSQALIRAKHTKTQTLLGREARERNVEGAFEVIGSDGLAGKKVFLIDDVCTTGATVNACSAALRAAGVERIVVAAAASPCRFTWVLKIL